MAPNIVFFLIDDMGWKDLSCAGSTFYKTPNIDRLRKEGVIDGRNHEGEARFVPKQNPELHLTNT